MTVRYHFFVVRRNQKRLRTLFIAFLKLILFSLSVALVRLITSSNNRRSNFAVRGLDAFAIKTTREHGFVALLYVDEEYVLLTKNFLCNLALYNSQYFRQLAIISTSPVVTEQLRGISHKLSVFDSVGNYKRSKKHISFGDYEYFVVTLNRLEVQNYLLQIGANVLVVEADATWFSSFVFEHVANLLKLHDFVSANDDYTRTRPLISAGFLASRSTEHSRKFFNEYTNLYRRELMRQSSSGRRIDLPGEQEYMTTLLRQNVYNCSLAWLDKCNFVSGQWYSNQHIRETCQSPWVIQNNWIVGSERKVFRAQENRHWFLNKQEVCGISVSGF